MCDFCENKSIASKLLFAGDYSEATGPFSLCFECLKFHIKCNGLPFGDYSVIDEELFGEAIWMEENK